MPVLKHNTYGKSSVKMMKVIRNGNLHSIKDIVVETRLEGDFLTAHTEGDNSKVIPTDTQKNMVYAFGKQYDFQNIEDFGLRMSKYILDHYDHVSKVKIKIYEDLWKRIKVDGNEHEHSFTQPSTHQRFCKVIRTRENTVVKGGISGLKVLKTTKSGFVNFHKDNYTTLPEADDRVFATTVTAKWLYNTENVDYTKVWDKILNLVWEGFATHDSKSVQQTLYYIATNAINQIPEIEEITFNMPNQHKLLVDLAPFGLENNNEIFVASDAPFGVIEATVSRS